MLGAVANLACHGVQQVGCHAVLCWISLRLFSCAILEKAGECRFAWELEGLATNAPDAMSIFAVTMAWFVGDGRARGYDSKEFSMLDPREVEVSWSRS